MASIRFLPKIITICFKEKAEFNYKNNYRNSKLANFELNIIN